jgi:mono/diheme cytochrome c family protein
MRNLFKWISTIFFFSVAMVTATMLSSQQNTPKPPSTTSNQNPVRQTTATQARAKQVYGYDCSMCHGPSGHGVTNLKKDFTGDVPDLANPASIAQQSDKDLYQIIWSGKDKMPGEQGRLKANEVWSLVTYVRALGAQKPGMAKDSAAR